MTNDATTPQIPLDLLRRALVTAGVPREAADRYRPLPAKLAADSGDGKTLRIDGPIVSPVNEKIDKLIFGDAIGIGPNAIADFLAEADGADVTFLINSPGGSCSACADIVAQIEMYSGKVTAKIVGDAASAASVIAAACARVEVGTLSMVMIHAAWSFVIGNAKELRAEADVLDKIASGFAEIYAARMDRKKIESMLGDGEDHWLSAKDALDCGFADAELPKSAKAGKADDKADDKDDDKADGDPDDAPDGDGPKDGTDDDAKATTPPAEPTAAGDDPGDPAEPPAGDPGDDGDPANADGDPDGKDVPRSEPPRSGYGTSLLLDMAHSLAPTQQEPRNGNIRPQA